MISPVSTGQGRLFLSTMTSGDGESGCTFISIIPLLPFHSFDIRMLFLLFSLLLFLLFSVFLKSASHIAANPKVSAKVKKDNIKYAAWAANQINRAYKVSH